MVIKRIKPRIGFSPEERVIDVAKYLLSKDKLGDVSIIDSVISSMLRMEEDIDRYKPSYILRKIKKIESKLLKDGWDWRTE